MRYVLIVSTVLVVSAFLARALLSSSPAGRRASDQQASVVWSAGMETGDLSEWEFPGRPNHGGGEFNSDGGDAVANTTVARTGQWSAQLTLPDGSGGTRLFRWREPREYEEAYYSAWFYFPNTYRPDVWWNIFQFKTRTARGSDPAWAINVGNRPDGTMFLYLFDDFNRQSHSQSAVDLPPNTWVNITCFLRQSAFRRGQVKCWQDGVVLWDLNGVTTNYPEGVNEWSVNNYSDAVSPSPTILFIDDATVSPSAVYPSLPSDTVVSGFEAAVTGSAFVLDDTREGWSASHGAAPWLSLTVASGVRTGEVQWEKTAIDLSRHVRGHRPGQLGRIWCCNGD